jgi:hypothetical protein
VEFNVWNEISGRQVPASGSQKECLGQSSGNGANLFVLRVTDKSGTRTDAEKRLEIAITAPVPDPQITFTVNPTAIHKGECVTVTWNVTNLAPGDTIVVGNIGSENYQHTASGKWRDCPILSTGYYLEVDRNGTDAAGTYFNVAVDAA